MKFAHGCRRERTLSIILSWRIFLILKQLALVRARAIYLTQELALLPFTLVGDLFKQDICKLNGFIESLLCLIMLLHLFFVLVMKIRLIRLVVLEEPLQYESFIQLPSLWHSLKSAEMLPELIADLISR